MNTLSKKIKFKHAFTLLELVLAMAIFSAVAMAIYGFMLAGNRTFVGGVNQYDAQSELRMVSDYIVKSTRFATSLSLESSLDATLDPEYNYMYIENGYLVNMVADGTSHNEFRTGGNINSYAFSGEVEGRNTMLAVLLNKAVGDQTYSIQTSTELPNLSIRGIEIDSGGQVIKYSKSFSMLSNPTSSTSSSTTESTTEQTTSDPSETIPTVVTVTIRATQNNFQFKNYKMVLKNDATGFYREIIATENVNNIVFTDVPVNVTYNYILYKKLGQGYVESATGTKDVTIFNVEILVDVK